VSSRCDVAGRRRAGFTLIELVVVIAVISVLAGLVGPLVFRNVGDARATTAKAQIELFGLALEQYRLDNDYYPSTAQGLDALRSAPAGEPPARNWRGPYLRKPVPADPWGRGYVYSSPDQDSLAGYQLQSLGRDGRTGGAGEDADIAS
jgi:general secretion pathway protein G